MELLAVAFVILFLAGCFSSSDSTGGSVDAVDEDGPWDETDPLFYEMYDDAMDFWCVSGAVTSAASARVGIGCRLRGHVPQTDCLVPTSRGDTRAIRAETHAEDKTRMSLERVEFLARRRVP